MVNAIEDGEKIGALIARAKLVKKEIDFPYVQIAAPEPHKNARAGKARKF
jgi:hypothetical protein